MSHNQATSAFASFSHAQGAALHVFEIIDRESKIDPLSSEGEKPASRSGDIEFRSVSFYYELRTVEGAAPVLKDRCMLNKPGVVDTQLVGGKSFFGCFTFGLCF